MSSTVTSVTQLERKDSLAFEEQKENGYTIRTSAAITNINADADPAGVRIAEIILIEERINDELHK